MKSNPVTQSKAGLGFLAGALAGALTVFGVLEKPWKRTVEKDIVAIVASVGDEQITVAEFQRMATKRSGIGGTGAGKKALLDEMILNKALLARAKAEGLDKDDQVLREIQNLLVAKVREKHLAEQRASLSKEPTEEAIRAHYAESIALFEKPEKRHLAMIFLSRDCGGKDEEVLLNELLELRRAVRTAKDRKEADSIWTLATAERSSDRSSRYRGGDIGVFDESGEYRTDPAVIQTGFGLAKPGDISDPVAGEAGFYLVKLLGITEGGARPFEEVRTEVRHRLIRHRQKEAQDRFNRETLEAVEVEVREDVLERIDVDGNKQGFLPSPPSLAG